MISELNNLKKALGQELPVYYIASTERSLLQEAARIARGALLNGETEETRLDGPAPDMDEAVSAAGMISFFGTRRLIELREIQPTAMDDKDVDELAALFGDVDNSVLLVTALYKDKKAAGGKKAKKLFSGAKEAGFAVELAKPGAGESLKYMGAVAARLETGFAPGAAELLLERAGEDWTLLKTEVEKLAALCGYREITTEAVEQYGAHNVEADVFMLLRLITEGRKAAAFQKMDELFGLRYEPIAVAAALSGGYVDMLRVRLAQGVGKTPAQVHKDMGYTGSDWRLRKARDNAARYSTPNLIRAVKGLAKLDMDLKSSAFSDKNVLLQAQVAELLLLREA